MWVRPGPAEVEKSCRPSRRRFWIRKRAAGSSSRDSRKTKPALDHRVTPLRAGFARVVMPVLASDLTCQFHTPTGSGLFALRVSVRPRRDKSLHYTGQRSSTTRELRRCLLEPRRHRRSAHAAAPSRFSNPRRAATKTPARPPGLESSYLVARSVQRWRRPRACGRGRSALALLRVRRAAAPAAMSAIRSNGEEDGPRTAVFFRARRHGGGGIRRGVQVRHDAPFVCLSGRVRGRKAASTTKSAPAAGKAPHIVPSPRSLSALFHRSIAPAPSPCAAPSQSPYAPSPFDKTWSAEARHLISAPYVAARFGTVTFLPSSSVSHAERAPHSEKGASTQRSVIAFGVLPGFRRQLFRKIDRSRSGPASFVRNTLA